MSISEALAAGADGEQVVELQQRLQHLGYYQGAVDGYYGDSTQTAVADFQRNSGQSEDGIVGAETWDRLEAEAAAAGYAGGEQELTPGQLSEDGQWRWDGTDWVAAEAQEAAPAAIEVGQLSDDGQWRWDGTDWVAAGQDQAQTTAAAEPEAQPEAKPWTREINEEIDAPDTEAAQLPTVDAPA